MGVESGEKLVCAHHSVMKVVVEKSLHSNSLFTCTKMKGRVKLAQSTVNKLFEKKPLKHLQKSYEEMCGAAKTSH